METTTAETLPLLTLHHRKKLRRQIRAAGVTREEQPFLLNRLPSRRTLSIRWIDRPTQRLKSLATLHGHAPS